MNEKKKLKKLVLKKEEIVNLNDYQMGQMKGGSSMPCSSTPCAIASVALTWEIGKEIYNAGKDASKWDCPPSKQKNCMTNVSDKWVHFPDGSKSCEIPEVDIYAHRP